MSNLNNFSESDKHRTSKKDETLDNSMFNIPKDSEKGFPLLHISEQYYSFSDLIVTDEIKERLENVISENRSAEKLFSYGLKPKNKILFCGPPGTGKTLSAKIISSVMGYPLVYVMFDSILSSYLGETATNLRRIFDFIEKGKFVVLFDEFDIVGKKRDDPHEHGEIKRVVNNFMQMLDNFESRSIIIAATNHQHLLDKAVWRRFDDIIYFDLPDIKRRKQLFEKYLKVLRRSKDFTLDQLARRTKDYSAADITQICEEALRKSIINNEKIVTKDHIMWAISEQKRRKKTISPEN
ncbi:MAG: ATP-binding protein [Nitrosopumilus sp.]|nr:ATP-binding protein [Nitrosopumilus sp.]